MNKFQPLTQTLTLFLTLTLSPTNSRIVHGVHSHNVQSTFAVWQMGRPGCEPWVHFLVVSDWIPGFISELPLFDPQPPTRSGLFTRKG